MSRSTRRIAGVAIAGACVAALAAPALAAPTAGPDTSKAPGKTQFDIQLLSFNDFHGNLEPPAGSGGRMIAGHFADVADTDWVTERTAMPRRQRRRRGVHRDQAQGGLRTGHPYIVTVAAGDIVGAFAAAVRRVPRRADDRGDEQIGLDAAAVGNHEFDEGYKELQRLRRRRLPARRRRCAQPELLPRTARSRVRTSRTSRPT